MNPPTYTTDTSAVAFEVQLDILRKMSPCERIKKMCALSRLVRNVAFDAIRRRHLEFNEDEIQVAFIELTYGESLADDVRRWKQRDTRRVPIQSIDIDQREFGQILVLTPHRSP